MKYTEGDLSFALQNDKAVIFSILQRLSTLYHLSSNTKEASTLTKPKLLAQFAKQHAYLRSSTKLVSSIYELLQLPSEIRLDAIHPELLVRPPLYTHQKHTYQSSLIMTNQAAFWLAMQAILLANGNPRRVQASFRRRGSSVVLSCYSRRPVWILPKTVEVLRSRANMPIYRHYGLEEVAVYLARQVFERIGTSLSVQTIDGRQGLFIRAPQCAQLELTNTLQ